MKLLKVKMNQILSNKLATALFSGFLLLSLTGCLDDDGDTLPEPVPVAYVSIYHGAPAASALDIVIDNENPINSQPFEYTKYTSGYIPFYTGERSIKFTAHNASNTLADTTVNLKENKVYSVFVVADTSDAGGIEPLIVEDSFSQPATGKAVIRLVNLSPDAEAIALTMEDTDAPVFTNLAYKKLSSFHEIEAGRTSFNVTTAGGDEVLAAVSDENFQEGRVYTLVVRGFKNPPSGNSNELGVQVLPNFFSY